MENRHASENSILDPETNRQLLESANTAIIIVQDYKLLFVNHQTELLTGYCKTELLSQDIFNIVHPEDRSLVASRYHLRIHGENVPDNYEFRIVTKQNVHVWVEIRASLIRWENENAVLCFIASINDRKLAMDTIKHNENVLNSIFNASPTGILLLENKIIKKVNNKICELTGYRESELLDKSTALLYPDLDTFLQASTETHTSLQKKDGSFFYAKIIFSPFDSGNLSAGVCATIIDITREKQVEKELACQNVLLNSIVNSLEKTIIVALDKNYCYMALNENHRNEMKKIYNTEIEIGKCMLDYISVPEIKPLVLNSFERVLKGDSFTEIQHQPLIDIWYEFNWSPIRTINQEIVGICFSAQDITERKTMENEARKKESLLRKIYEILPVGLWIADKDGTLISVNPAGKKIWGAELHATQKEYGKFKARRLPSGQEIAPEDWALAHSIKKGITVTDELLEIDAFDGTKKIILNFTAPVLDDDGKILGAIIVNQDITEPKNTLDLLRESENRFRAFVEQSADGLALVDEKGNFIEWNSSMERITGYTREEIIGKPWLDQNLRMMQPENNTPERIAAIKLIVQDLLCPNEPKKALAPVNATVLTKDGQVIVVQQLIFTITTQSGRMIGSINRDITTISKAEKALKESEERFRQIADNVNDGFWIVDLKSQKCVLSNPAMDSLFGRCLTGMRSTEIYNLIHIDDYNLMKSERCRLADGHHESEFKIVKTDGNIRSIRCHSFPVVGENGVPTRLVGITTDITELKKAASEAEEQRQQMMQIDKMVTLGTLVSGVAHEINNPNNYLMLNATIIERAWKDIIPIIDKHFESNPQFTIADLHYTKARKLLPDIIHGLSDGTQRIKRIVDSLRDYVRNDADGMNQEVDINKVVETSVVLLANMIRNTTDNFFSHLDPLLPRINGNSYQLEQVVINLISNACQALERRSQRIEVFTYADGEDVVLKIVDGGRGISKENLNRIFDPFFTTKRDLGGTGLGLSISKRIIHTMGGSIIVESKEANGTSISVRFPLVSNSLK